MAAAIKLGYKFLLIEQQFPNIEKTILEGNMHLYLAELVKQMRPFGFRGQYSRDAHPPFTALEVLALIEMGCRGIKQSDGSLVLAYPKKIREEEVNHAKPIKQLKRFHSWA